MKFMKKFTFVFLGLILFSVLTINGQTKLELTPVFDAAIGFHDNYNTDDNNYGSAIQNAAYSIPGSNGGSNVNRSLIKFDLTKIPQGANIIEVKLNLYALGKLGNLNGHTGLKNNGVIQRIIEDWSENTVTWNSQPNTTNQNEVYLPASNSSLQDYVNIDVTLLVKDLINNNNYGILLKLQEEISTNALIFASTNSLDSTKFPKLEITYDNCITILSKKDAAIGYHDNYNTDDNNYGTAVQNAAYTISGSNGGLNVNRALIDFDLTSIPKGSIITSANLNLYAIGQLGILNGHVGDKNNSVLQRITENWKEDKVTWNSQPASTNINQVSLPASNNSLQDYLDIDVTSLIQDLIDYNNYGVILKLENEIKTNALLFCSSNHTDKNKHPKIEVCYSNPVNTKNELNNELISFNLYPNPSSGIVHVKINSFDSNQNAILEIFTIQGLKVKTFEINSEISSINLQNYSSGVYIVNLIIKNQFMSKKIILNN
jgi:hypothetical protein